ncbi:uncharacterized protein LOC122662683 [Telopea speciosissima]|uniref:uncharacterized protein LOC122662683 n=1 Tax=Telopea speciosissima TaxID=54955 RepID=UPI001CC66CD2|nr:uncharacterized protein LOC122662683 [Telopea speciosissima]
MPPQLDKLPLENRPGILMVGSPNVGKRTLLSRLLSVDFDDASDSSSEVLCNGWTITTKYYTADVSVWMAHLDDEFSIGKLPSSNQLAALVMVFDMNDLSSFVVLKDWVSHTNIQQFDILLCIGNKADLLPGHSAHAEYRRHLQKHGEASSDPHPEFLDYGILETEGSSLLGDEEPSWEIRRSCLEWCSQYNIEYIEACASNVSFDKCLSVDGDLQGVERLFGALSAHMWPGMVLKSGNKIPEPSLPDNEELSEEESDYEVEYEILSAGSSEPWDGTEEVWISASGKTATTEIGSSSAATETVSAATEDVNREHKTNGSADMLQPSASEIPLQEDRIVGVPEADETDKATGPDDGTHLGLEELEQLMSEIGNMRDSLRLMPDFQRREMAAKLAMKVATLFGEDSDDERNFD